MTPDPKNTQTISVVRPAVPYAANANIVFDTRGYVGSVAFIVNSGLAFAGTSPTLDIYLQSTANSNGVGGTNLNVSLTQVANTNSHQVLTADLRGANRYIVLVTTIGGSSSPNFALAVSAVGTKQVQ